MFNRDKYFHEYFFLVVFFCYIHIEHIEHDRLLLSFTKDAINGTDLGVVYAVFSLSLSIRALQ